MWAESSLQKASVQCVSLSVEAMGNSWSGSKHSQTSQVNPSEPPQPDKERISAAAEIRVVRRGSALHCKENWKKRWRKRVAGGRLGETKI